MSSIKTKQKVYSSEKLHLTYEDDFEDIYFAEPDGSDFLCKSGIRQFFVLPPNTTTIWLEVSLQQWPDNSGYRIKHTGTYSVKTTQCTQTNICIPLFNWLDEHNLLGKKGYWRILYEE